MSTERFNIIYHDYPEQFNLSEHRRVKLWTKADETKLGVKLKKRLADGHVVWGRTKSGGTALYDKEASKFIPKNPKAAGTPKVQKITAQMLWSSGPGIEWARKKMRDFLHDWFVPGIVRQMPDELFTREGYFIHFEYIFFYPFAEKHRWEQYQDYLNHAFVYGKTFEDTLVELKILKDDGPKYVRGGYPRYVDIMDMEDNQSRRLEIKIHFCRNNERIS
jgi:hypothetical protein